MVLEIPEIEIISGARQFEAYRNIATCDPTQALYDDLVDEDEAAVLEYIDNRSSGIDHLQPNHSRFEQYGRIEDSLLCFDEKFWRWGRYSDGTFGVWYGALEEETSIQETLYHRPEIDRNDLLNTKDPIIQARRMFKADLTATRHANLLPLQSRYPMILHPTDYSFCQTLGRTLKQKALDMFLVPSVRKVGGTCIPVLNANIIRDRPVRTYFFIFPLDGSQPIVTQRQF